jgi:hypothetical protein
MEDAKAQREANPELDLFSSSSLRPFAFSFASFARQAF